MQILFTLNKQTNKNALKIKLKNTLKICKHKHVDPLPKHLQVICREEYILYSQPDFCD